MSNILFLKTSPKEEGSISTELGEYLVNQLTSVSKSTVTKRQLDEEIPFINQQIINGLYVDDSQKTVEQKEALKLSDTIVEDVNNHDTPLVNYILDSSDLRLFELCRIVVWLVVLRGRTTEIFVGS